MKINSKLSCAEREITSYPCLKKWIGKVQEYGQELVVLFFSDTQGVAVVRNFDKGLTGKLEGWVSCQDKQWESLQTGDSLTLTFTV